MSTIVLLEIKAKPEKLAELKAYIKGFLPDTRAYEGCHGVDVYGGLDDASDIVLYERWESRKHYETYLAWRVDTGVVAKLGDYATTPPSLRYFETVDA